MEINLMFNKSYSKFIEIFLNPKKNNIRYVLLSGGRGSGKTTVLNTILLFRLLKNYNENIIYTRYTNTSLNHSIKDLMDKIDKFNLPFTKKNENRIQKISYKNSEIIFSGLFTSVKNQTLKSIPNSSTFIVEEASSIKSEDEFSTVHKSLRHNKLNNVSILLFNPTNQNSFIYQYFYSKNQREIRQIEFNGKIYEYEQIISDNILHVHTTFLDNIINLPIDFIKEAIDTQINNENTFKRDYLGIFVDVFENTIFKNIEYSDVTFPNDLPSVIGVDFGFKDFTAFVKVSLDVKNKIFYCENLFYENNVSIEKLKNIFIDLFKKYNNTFICDINLKYLTNDINLMFKNSIGYKDTKVSVYEQLVKLSMFKIVTNNKKLYLDLITYKQVTNNVFSNDEGNHLTDAFRYGAFHLLKALNKSFIEKIFLD